MYKYTIDENGNKVPALNQYGEHAIEQRIYHAPTLASGNAYYVIDGEKVIYQAAENSYYGKGQITNVNDSSAVVENSFAIVTKNPEIEALLAEGVTIRVQRKFIDTWYFLLSDSIYDNTEVEQIYVIKESFTCHYVKVKVELGQFSYQHYSYSQTICFDRKFLNDSFQEKEIQLSATVHSSTFIILCKCVRIYIFPSLAC